MGLSIEEAIKRLETYTIPCGKYKAAYDLAVETMRKYQTIEQIRHRVEHTGLEPAKAYELINEVIEDED